MKVSIEKNIAIPTDGRNRRKAKLAGIELFSKMEVGNSIFVPGIRTAGLASYSAQKLGFHFTQRKTTVDGILGLRIWRIK